MYFFNKIKLWYSEFESLESIIEDLNAKQNLDNITERFEKFKSRNRFWYNPVTKSSLFYSELSISILSATWLGAILGLVLALSLPGLLAGVFLGGAVFYFLGFYLFPKIYDKVNEVKRVEQEICNLNLEPSKDSIKSKLSKSNSVEGQNVSREQEKTAPKVAGTISSSQPVIFTSAATNEDNICPTVVAELNSKEEKRRTPSVS